MKSTFPENPKEMRTCPKCKDRVHKNGFCDDHGCCWTDCGAYHYYKDGVAVVAEMET